MTRCNDSSDELAGCVTLLIGRIAGTSTETGPTSGEMRPGDGAVP